MATLSQDNLPLRVATPLGKDVFIATGFSGEEAISRLFVFQLDLLALSTSPVDFSELLGKAVSATIEIPGGGERHFSGVVRRVIQGGEAAGPDDSRCTTFRIEVVPEVWLLTRTVRSRIFQQLSVPDILKEAFAGIDVAYEIDGTFEARDYCAQYRESDFDFVSRLMEEEGIYYFFVHEPGNHRMVLANTPASHPDLPIQSTLEYEPIVGGTRRDSRVHEWQKQQELRSGKYTLWDHSFELPTNNLEATAPILGSVQAGKVTHKLKAGGNEAFEIYDFPGEYAKRFDGVAPGGGDRDSDLQKVFQDNVRTAKLRMQQEESASIWIEGVSDCRQMTGGHKFKLSNHGKSDGTYVVTSVRHRSKLSPAHRTGGRVDFSYDNEFVCVPESLPFRPVRTTARPRVAGAQTATVVGPSGEEIFTDKYGRVKVQFHWDREGKKDNNSSCWIRVATTWAGKQWGAIHIPRIGQEVLVDYLEGDPDQPIIVGSVYNADHMPPYELPANKTQSGIRSRSTANGAAENFNEIRFEDKKDQEQIYLHAERDLRVDVERNDHRTVGRHSSTEVLQGRRTLVKGESKIAGDDETESDSGTSWETVRSIATGSNAGDYLEVEKDHFVYVGGAEVHQVEEHGLVVRGPLQITVLETGNQSTEIHEGNQEVELRKGNQKIEIKLGNQSIELGKGNRSVKLDLGKITEEAMEGIELKVGSNSIKVDQTGVAIKGMMVKIEAQTVLQVKGSAMAQVEGGGMLMLKGGITMIN
jgi:type VI secretion system secreted protein VgrG